MTVVTVEIAPTILLLPGLFGSGPDHWQSIWQRELPRTQRVCQRDWSAPDRDAWVDELNRVVCATAGPILLAAHSLGCATVVHWAQRGKLAQLNRIRGALLVAVPDVERVDAPAQVHSFAPLPSTPLPFPSVVVASSDDPWCGLARAEHWANAWGATWQSIGALGHINAESGLGAWQQGQTLLRKLANVTGC
ncbi:MAG: alpha/beta hydrolase [Herbaspirillum sp.]